MNQFFQRYRRAIVWVIVVGFALSIFGAGILQRLGPRQPGTADETLLSVDGRDVTREQLFERYERLLEMYQMYGMDFSGTEGDFRSRQMLAEATEELIRAVLQESQADRLGVRVPSAEVDAAFQQQYAQILEQVDGNEQLLEQYLAAQGTTLQEFKRDMRSQAEQELINQRLRSTVVGTIEPTRDELENYYEQHRNRYIEQEEQLRLGHIKVADVDLAEALLSQLREDDVDLAALAAEHSLDERTRETGGEIDWFASGESDLPPVVENTAFDLQEGEVTMVGEGDHQHLIKVLERRPAEYKPLAEVEDEVRDALVSEREREKWNEWYADLRAEADVQIRDPLIQAFVTYREDRDAAVETLEQAYADGEVSGVRIRLYLGRMHEAIKDDTLTQVAELEEIEDPTSEQQADLEAAREKADRHREAALEHYLAFSETGEADEELFERLLALDPDRPVARYRLGEVYRENGEHSLAKEQYERALELNPEFVGAYVGMGDVYMEEGLYGRATEYYREALDRDPESISLRVKLSEAYSKDGLPDEAQQLLESVLQDDPDNVTALTLLGDLLLDKGQTEAALEEYEKAYQLNPTAHVQTKRAQALAEAGRVDEAKEAFTRLVRQFPYRADAYIGLGDLYYAQEQQQDAVDQYRQALRLSPALETQEYIARRILELRPQDIDMRFRLASFLEQLGQHTEAMAEYERILDLDSENLHAFLGLGDLYLDAGAHDQAVQQYEQGLAVAQTDREKREMYDRIVAAEEDRVGPEEPLTEEGLQALWQRAQFYVDTGQSSQARSDLQRIHDADPEFRAEELIPLLEELGGDITRPDDAPQEDDQPPEENGLQDTDED